jgi:hypothetical protein
VVENNVHNMTAYKLAELITDNWLDSLSDSGALYERSKKTLDTIRQSVSDELWAEAVTIAQRRWGQQ